MLHSNAFNGYALLADGLPCGIAEAGTYGGIGKRMVGSAVARMLRLNPCSPMVTYAIEFL